MPTISLDFATLRRAYDSGAATPEDVACDVLARIAAAGDDRVWIARVPERELRDAARRLEDGRKATPGAAPPLYGIPFAVKDNIDVTGMPTTAGCPGFAYTPSRSAAAVERLLAAGALLVGKTNLDQFATGLVGVRSPYGTSRNPFDPDRIPGGSSSGSAVAVAAGLVSFALGTDTAGSGRVPAGFNNIVGLKPTRGLLSTSGVVPACRSLDCVSIFALTVPDAAAALGVAQGFDPEDAYSRPAPPGFAAALAIPPGGFRFGILPPAQREFFGNAGAAALYETAIERMAGLGGTAVEIDYAPFASAASLLYGPFVAERTAALRGFLAAHAESFHPVTRQIIAGGAALSAADAFDGLHALQALRQQTLPLWRTIDFLLLPTSGTDYRIAEVEADPIRLNANLGHYTNFVNLLDLCAIAVPNGFQPDDFPAGLTLVAPAWHDIAIASVAAAFHEAACLTLGATGAAMVTASTPAEAIHKMLGIAVVGAHLSGQPLNHQLVDLGGRLRSATRTAPCYRLYALPDGRRPGLVRMPEGGGAIEVEIWDLPTETIGAFLATVAAPLAIGTVDLLDGGTVKGFLCEPHAVSGCRDITSFGGWRGWIAARDAL